ncbi:MAG TPA: hypothetical protein PLW14_09080 [Chlorobiota bacterium]|nr:hypothetical protein [Chlorobiota bacterium]
MPRLVAQAEVQGLLPKSILNLFAQSLVNFDDVEREASRIIADETGIELPTAPAQRSALYDWTITPMAWIITYLASAKLESASDDALRTFHARYQEALRIVRARRNQPKASNPSVSQHTGTIEGLLE